MLLERSKLVVKVPLVETDKVVINAVFLSHWCYSMRIGTHTLSPTAKFVTPSPTLATTPEESVPRMAGYSLMIAA